MIDKDESTLENIMDDNYTLTHMSGKVQSKMEYIMDIINGVLNYYNSTIYNPVIEVYEDKYARFVADVTLDAKVYGIKGTWTLKSEILLEKKNNEWILSKWEINLKT